MPIGTIIGWLIGQLIVAITINKANSSVPMRQTETSTICRQFAVLISLVLGWTALIALIGTVIELIVR